MAFGTFRRDSVDEILVKDLDGFSPATELDADGSFERVLDADFSPDGDTLALAVISESRPLLLRTTGLRSASAAASLLLQPRALGGVSPSLAAVLPLAAAGEPIAAVYGDDMGLGIDLPDLGVLERFVAEASRTFADALAAARRRRDANRLRAAT